MQQPILSINTNTITIFWPELSETQVITKGDILYSEKLFELIDAQDFDALYQYVSMHKSGKMELDHNLSIDFNTNQVFYNGELIEASYLTNKILQIHAENGPLSPIKNFLGKLYNNPSKTAIDELFMFLEETNIALFADGDIAAYKMVQSDYLDIHSNTCDYSIGKIVEMPRHKVDDNRQKKCSAGLHFCSKNYIPTAYRYESDNRMILVKINPADVVCIPYDYDNQKARACRITSYADITNYDEINSIYEKYAVVNAQRNPDVDSDKFVANWKSQWENGDEDPNEYCDEDCEECDCDCECNDEHSTLDEKEMSNHIHIH